jgi:hypothetical protein
MLSSWCHLWQLLLSQDISWVETICGDSASPLYHWLFVPCWILLLSNFGSLYCPDLSSLLALPVLRGVRSLHSFFPFISWRNSLMCLVNLERNKPAGSALVWEWAASRVQHFPLLLQLCHSWSDLLLLLPLNLKTALLLEKPLTKDIKYVLQLGLLLRQSNNMDTLISRSIVVNKLVPVIKMTGFKSQLCHLLLCEFCKLLNPAEHQVFFCKRVEIIEPASQFCQEH